MLAASSLTPSSKIADLMARESAIRSTIDRMVDPVVDLEPHRRLVALRREQVAAGDLRWVAALAAAERTLVEMEDKEARYAKDRENLRTVKRDLETRAHNIGVDIRRLRRKHGR